MFLAGVGVVKTALEYTATMSVSADDNAVFCDCGKDKMLVLGPHVLEHTLDDVIAIGVDAQMDCVGTQSVDDVDDLFWPPANLNDLLNRTGTVQVESCADKTRSDALNDLNTLVVRHFLDELLKQVVAERINHHFCEMVERLSEDQVAKFLLLLFQKLLQQTAAILILALKRERGEETMSTMRKNAYWKEEGHRGKESDCSLPLTIWKMRPLISFAETSAERCSCVRGCSRSTLRRRLLEERVSSVTSLALCSQGKVRSCRHWIIC